MYVIVAPIQIKPGYKDQFVEAVVEATFQAHLQAPHLLKFRETKAWRVEDLQRARRGSANIWPPDSAWK